MGKRGDTRGVSEFLVRIATCQLSLGAFVLLGLVCFRCGNPSRADSCVAQSPCLSVWVTPLTRPHTSRPAIVCASECVCSACVYTGCATPCLKSTAQPIAPIHIKASIIHPTSLFIMSRHFLLSSPVFTQKSSYSSNAVFTMPSAPLQYIIVNGPLVRLCGLNIKIYI